MRTPSSLTIRLAAFSAGAGICAPHLGAQSSMPRQRSAEQVFADSPSVWFEAYATRARVSSDGRWAIYSGRILDLQRRREAKERVWPGLAEQRGAAFGPRGELLLLGTSASKTGWFTQAAGSPTLLPLPPDATPQWSPDGGEVAFSRAGATDSVFAGPLGNARAYPVGGVVTGFAWLPEGDSLVVIALEPRGTSTLSRLDLASGRATVVARDLDAPTLFSSPVAVAPDGRRAYVALAGSGAPSPEERHEPHANRQLSIYEVELGTGYRHAVVPTPQEGDAFAPCVASGYLYWTHSASEVSAVVVPTAGGTVRLVMRGAQVPSWRPDGRQIGFVYGDWRWVDWAIDWDGGAVDVDTSGRPVGALQPLITGYHEDFQPVWSPRGRWVAYHSHRAKTPVPSYLAPGSSDDIWLRRVGAPARDPSEIRLTDFGWEAGPPDWSRDGTRLLFVSWERGGRAGVSYPYIVTIDTATGRAVGHGRLPLPAQVHNSVWAAWSPVTDDVALEEDLGGGRHALWIAASNGTSARKVTEYPMKTYGGVSWTPDGKALVYAALTGGRMQLFAIPAAGGTPQQLTHDSGSLLHPRVSPSGTLIAATRLVHRKEIWRVALPH
jgi:Tol biopolymer transport system component